MDDVDSISVAVSGIDINKVEPLDSRRVVAFINQFLCTSATFLNQFATQCESKLDAIQQKLFKIESRLSILEGKLQSLPECDIQTSTPIGNTSTQPQPQAQQLAKPIEESCNINISGEGESTAESKPLKPDSQSQSQEAHAEEMPVSDQSSVEVSNIDVDGDGEGAEKEKESFKNDPRYSKYFKMACVGVPVPAIKLKMMSEGVDPNILDMK